MVTSSVKLFEHLASTANFEEGKNLFFHLYDEEHHTAESFMGRLWNVFQIINS